ncbi:Down syndrome cell adhesion molecule homolog [Actinia tenebrosa]|uniref:Down syndrome cell adhesion molecule homolog n=1 Tax=Actinia tenebrosa TaxID=6105 RepID=A0A6P8HHB2_ACTTE|nr:Down syndrome cell adhesion molecule homolog [Actinia tenebrosa]
MNMAIFRTLTFCCFILGIRGQNTGCVEQSLVGRNNLSIPDSSYDASSHFDYRYAAHNAKLYGKNGWAPRYSSNPGNYLQIDLGTLRVITAVATQGNGGDPDSVQHKEKYEWVIRYKINYSDDSSNWIRYKDESGTQKLFKGNTDSNSVVRHDLTNPQLARYIRFVPVEYHRWKTMRVNVYVTNQEPPLVHFIPYKRSINLTWTYEKCSPTYHITGYLVKVENRNFRVIGDDRRYAVTNLKPYTEYSVSIKAVTQVGYGAWSNVTTIKTAIAEPESIPSLNATETSSETIVLKWKLQKSEFIHGPLWGYRITYTPQGGKTKMIEVSDVGNYTLTSLLKYTTYNITIAVRNTKYTGPPSNEQRVTTMEDGEILK